MVEYVCTNCKYQFNSEIERKQCPYCGENKVIKEPNAQDLIA